MSSNYSGISLELNNRKETEIYPQTWELSNSCSMQFLVQRMRQRSENNHKNLNKTQDDRAREGLKGSFVSLNALIGEKQWSLK